MWGRRRRRHVMLDRGWFNGAVALVFEGFGSRTLLKPMPQRRWTRPDPPQRPEACLLWGWIRLLWGLSDRKYSCPTEKIRWRFARELGVG